MYGIHSTATSCFFYIFIKKTIHFIWMHLAQEVEIIILTHSSSHRTVFYVFVQYVFASLVGCRYWRYLYSSKWPDYWMTALRWDVEMRKFHYSLLFSFDWISCIAIFNILYARVFGSFVNIMCFKMNTRL